MPIRPEMRAKYPPNWRVISKRIRELAGQKCQWCSAPNRKLIVRDRKDPAKWKLHYCNGVCMGEGCDAVHVVLTVAHLDHDPTNNADENLRALCQRCHLRYDAKEHARNAANTRRVRRDAATGQRRMFDG